MRSTRTSRLAGVLAAAALSVAGCGGSTVTVGAGDSATASSAATDSPSGSAPTSAMVVMRTGGIAGVVDMVRIAADGTASITSKTSKSRACTPAAKSVARLRAIDLTAMQVLPSMSSRMADGFNYSVKSASGSAAVSEGDDDSRRAELLDAAAAVVASCLAGQSGSGSAGR
jgi:hypothetical protein